MGGVVMQNLEAAAYLGRIGLAEIMLFDRIHVHSLKTNIDALSATAPWHAAMLEYLCQNDVLHELRCDEDEDDVEGASKHDSGLPSSNRRKRARQPALQTQKDVKRFVDTLIEAVVDDSVRAYAIDLQRRNPTTTCVAIVGQHELWGAPPFRDEPTRVATVVDVIIRSLPVPAPDTPIERLLDFRNDPDTQAKLRSLRNWMRRVADTSASGAALADELEYAVHTYQEYMRIKRLKYRSGVLRAVVGASFEVVENLARFKPKAAFDALFTVRDQQVALMEAELAAPGRELAFIAKARQFSK
jgi:hypothetical protein